jgi:uncharacterized protein with LGFP repeats
MTRRKAPAPGVAVLSAGVLVLSGLVHVLPANAAPGPQARPVQTATEEVPMGSVIEPAAGAGIQARTTDPVAGVPATAPALTVTRTGTRTFSLVGVTWAHDPAVTDTLVHLRVQDPDGHWGQWHQLTADEAQQRPDAGPEAPLRGGTEPLWTGPSTGVEARLVSGSGAQPTDVRLDLVDPGSSPTDAAPGSPEVTGTAEAADAAAEMPPVHSRAQWGADESIRKWRPVFAATIKAGTIHHTADSNAYTATDVPRILRSIYRYHAVSRGWGDIGYHVIADKFGRLWEGRYGGLASTVIGAHAGGFNTGTFGISMLGNYELVAPTPELVGAVADFLAWKLALYDINPGGSVALTSRGGSTVRYPAGTTVRLPTIFAHRDTGRTACPGAHAYERMEEIRKLVAAKMAGT